MHKSGALIKWVASVQGSCEMYQTEVAAVKLNDSQLMTLKLATFCFQPHTESWCNMMSLHVYKKASLVAYRGLHF